MIPGRSWLMNMEFIEEVGRLHLINCSAPLIAEKLRNHYNVKAPLISTDTIYRAIKRFKTLYPEKFSQKSA